MFPTSATLTDAELRECEFSGRDKASPLSVNRALTITAPRFCRAIKPVRGRKSLEGRTLMARRSSCSIDPSPLHQKPNVLPRSMDGCTKDIGRPPESLRRTSVSTFAR